MRKLIVHFSVPVERSVLDGGLVFGSAEEFWTFYESVLNMTFDTGFDFRPLTGSSGILLLRLNDSVFYYNEEDRPDISLELFIKELTYVALRFMNERAGKIELENKHVLKEVFWSGDIRNLCSVLNITVLIEAEDKIPLLREEIPDIILPYHEDTGADFTEFGVPFISVEDLPLHLLNGRVACLIASISYGFTKKGINSEYIFPFASIEVARSAKSCHSLLNLVFLHHLFYLPVKFVLSTGDPRSIVNRVAVPLIELCYTDASPFFKNRELSYYKLCGRNEKTLSFFEALVKSVKGSYRLDAGTSRFTMPVLFSQGEVFDEWKVNDFPNCIGFFDEVGKEIAERFLMYPSVLPLPVNGKNELVPVVFVNKNQNAYSLKLISQKNYQALLSLDVGSEVEVAIGTMFEEDRERFADFLLKAFSPMRALQVKDEKGRITNSLFLFFEKMLKHSHENENVFREGPVYNFSYSPKRFSAPSQSAPERIITDDGRAIQLSWEHSPVPYRSAVNDYLVSVTIEFFLALLRETLGKETPHV